MKKWLIHVNAGWQWLTRIIFIRKSSFLRYTILGNPYSIYIYIHIYPDTCICRHTVRNMYRYTYAYMYVYIYIHLSYNGDHIVDFGCCTFASRNPRGSVQRIGCSRLPRLSPNFLESLEKLQTPAGPWQQIEQPVFSSFFFSCSRLVELKGHLSQTAGA